MRICIIGTGYVGLVTGACLANVGHVVRCFDSNDDRIACLNAGEIPFYEPGLSALVSKSMEDNTLFFHSELKGAIANAEICLIAVGTPSNSDGSADLKQVKQAAIDIGKTISGDIIVVNKSTVPVGTSLQIKKWIEDEITVRNGFYKISVASNPEFLKEGSAIEDFGRPDRIVIGSDDDEAVNALREMYSSFSQKRDKIIIMSAVSAELTKYASNAMLATRISFMNEIASICEKTGANINDVRIGMGADKRIGESFLYAGCGYGGSCFPKDVSSLISMQKQNGLNSFILSAVQEVNNRQKSLLAEKVKNHFGGDVRGKHIAVWGLSFKPKTDDVREAPALTFIRDITSIGAIVTAYCPKGTENAKKELGQNPVVNFAEYKYNALEGADALAVLTEWPEFRNPDFDEISVLLKSKVLFDGRNIYPRSTLERKGFTVYQIGM